MAEANAHATEHAEHTNYSKVYGILVVLFLISFIGPFVGENLEARWLTLITAFGIALVKAYLVAKHFMHLNVEKKYIVYLFVTMLAFMGLLFAGTAGDVMNHSGQNWVNVAAIESVEAGMAAGPVDHSSDDTADDEGGEAVAAAGDASGESLYGSRCAMCHMPTGEGTPGAFPPLVGSEWVTADPETPIRIILAGLQGEIDVGGTTYNAMMPGLGTLPDEEVAAIVTHIRTSWGNDASAVTPEQVAAVRDALGERGIINGGEELSSLRGE